MELMVNARSIGGLPGAKDPVHYLKVLIYVSFKYSVSDGSTQMDLDLKKNIVSRI